MARTPKPWFRSARGGWYATVDGTCHLLAKGKRNFPAAQKRLRELLAARDRGPIVRPGESPPLGELALEYEEHLRERQGRGEVSCYAVADFRRRSGGFVDLHGDTPADRIRPYMVEEWLRTRTTLGPTSRHDAVGAIKGITRYARRRGRLDVDPLAELPKPPRPKRREAVLDARRLPQVLAAIPPGPFRELMTFLHLTGCRPGEAAVLEAAHVDPARRVAVLPRHKTRAKTGKPRVIPLTAAALELITPLMQRHPEGPLFRTRAGNAWGRNAINSAIRRLRARTGTGRELVPYAMRHGWATDALAAGEPVALVAEALGHTSPRMLAEVYSHLVERTDLLAEAAERVRKGG